MPCRARFWLVGINLLVLVACVKTPDSYPAPEQHSAFRVGGMPSSEFLPMSHPDAPKSIVKDVNVSEAGPWRWTGAEPELRFFLKETQNRTLVCEFVINDRTFRDTGPVKISFYVNDHLAGEETYTSNGEKVFEKAIPAEWLRTDGETRVRAKIHNTWRTATGFTLGILLKRVGFVE